ncbi:MAG: glutamate racemase, partial [Candidatus Dadabacteria bacterium]|nr:glutamate racemase [Candidatus Dadabacteria bacterium]
ELRESGIDVLLLGCTHYPRRKNTIAGVMGKGIRLVDSAEETAKQTENILRSQGLLREDGKAQQMSFYLTDDSETFTSIASRFLGRPMEKTEVVDIV